MDENIAEVHELKGFIKSLFNDYQAVKNALTFQWSNGPVEGQINKLKTIKRKKVVFGYG